MAIQFVSVTCPQCGANLQIEEGREFAFCSYCGTKVMMTNENEHIVRTIDEAGIKQAETDRIVKLRQLDIEEKSNLSRKRLLIVWLAATVILLVVGIIGASIENTGMTICLILGINVALWGGLSLFSNDKKKKNRVIAGANEVMITASMMNYWEEYYRSVELLYRGAGFTNVTTVPLGDLNRFNQKKNGKVDALTINGSDEFDEGDVYPKNAAILITYHSK